MAKDLGITNVQEAKDKIPDLKVFGDGDTWVLLCKASSNSQGWMKSTKVLNVPGGCIVQVTTQQRSADGTHSIAEALTYVRGVQIRENDTGAERYLGYAHSDAPRESEVWEKAADAVHEWVAESSSVYAENRILSIEKALRRKAQESK